MPAPQRYTAKYIEVLLEEEPAITPGQLALWEWIASYYQCSLGEILRAAIPSVLLLESELLMHLHPECPPIDSLQLTDAEYLILEALQVQPLKVQQITEIVQRKQVLPLLHRMVAKGWIEQQQQLQEKYRPKKYVGYVFIQNFSKRNNCRNFLISYNGLLSKVNFYLPYWKTTQSERGKRWRY